MLSKSMHGKPLIYLDSAATAQKPNCVIDAIASFYRENYGTVHRAIYELAVTSTEKYQQVRKKIQSFLHAEKEEEIIFTRGTTEAINLVAACFGKTFVHKGDEIIISAMEHHSNIVPWQMLCEERGATLKVIPINEKGELILSSFASLLSRRTKLVAIAHISNTLGTLNPIKEMAAMAHGVGAALFVDGAQSAPHLPIDVQAMGADFFVFSGHKLYGPTGIGILYGKKDLLDAMPPYQGGGDMIKTVTFEKTTYNDLPLKFEAGTPMIAEVIGLGAAVDYIQGIGLNAISAWEGELLAYATEQMKQLSDVKIIGEAEHKGSLISFVVPGHHPLDIGTLLDLEGVAVRTGHLCAQPVMQFFNTPAFVRASFAFYNTPEEIDRFIAALKKVIAKLK